MMTVRQIEKQWKNEAWQKLVGELLAGRPERSLRLENALAGPIPAAALVLVRLDELSQPHMPLYNRLVRVILEAQEADGGWKDPLTTAICLRALMAGRGSGESIERGLKYLAQMQKTEGTWPAEPIKRLPADAFVSAFVLLMLGGEERFRNSVRFTEAVEWFELNGVSLDGEASRMWHHAALRCRVRRVRSTAQQIMSWS